METERDEEKDRWRLSRRSKGYKDKGGDKERAGEQEWRERKGRKEKDKHEYDILLPQGRVKSGEILGE